MKRDWFAKLLLIALIVVAGTLAAVTRTPDAGWVESLSKAVVIGPWIERLASLYRPPEVPPSSSDLEGGVEVVYRIDSRLGEVRPTIRIEAGSVLYEQASEDSPRLASLPSVSAELLDRRDDWYQVQHGGQRGWVRLPARGIDLPGEPPLGSEPAPPLPVPSRPPDPEVVAEALELLGAARETKTLADYTLHTDVRDRGLLVFLSAITAQLESIYQSRYGLTPLPGALEAVVLFSSQDDFRKFFAGAGRLAEVSAPGVLRGGVVATYTEDRAWNEIAATLMHELTHLLNKRALGPALPPWLDEGLADDLAQSRIEGLRVLPGTLGGSATRSVTGTVTRIDYTGAQAAILELARSAGAGGLPGLRWLLELDGDGFQEPNGRAQRYAQAAFFVRSLLDSPEPGRATAFRSFLRAVSEGGPVTAEALRSELDRSWPILDAGLTAFVERQAEAAGLPVSTASGSSSRQASEPSS